MIAVLCCSVNSIYKSMPQVDCYDIKRDVRTFAGGMPIVAHPPCRAWSAFCSHQAKPAIGEKELAPYCVELLRICGGVLEHPAFSKIYDELKLPKPGQGEAGGLYSIEVNQSWWGDVRTKRTWLLISGVDMKDLPEISYNLHNPSGDRRRWQLMSKTQRASTPPDFAKWLVEVAKRSERKAVTA